MSAPWTEVRRKSNQAAANIHEDSTTAVREDDERNTCSRKSNHPAVNTKADSPRPKCPLIQTQLLPKVCHLFSIPPPDSCDRRDPIALGPDACIQAFPVREHQGTYVDLIAASRAGATSRYDLEEVPVVLRTENATAQNCGRWIR